MPVTSRAAVAVPPAYAACPAGLAAGVRGAIGQRADQDGGQDGEQGGDVRKTADRVAATLSHHLPGRTC